MKQALFLLVLFVAFVGINMVSAEYLINRSSNTFLSVLFGVILVGSFYFLIYKPFKKLL